MEQDEIVQDSEALEVLGNTENREKKKKREAMFELTLFFVLGVLIGITLKTEAVKKFTIGFNDYQLKKTGQSYDTAALKQKLVDQMNQQQQAQAQIQAQQSQGAQTKPDQQTNLNNK